MSELKQVRINYPEGNIHMSYFVGSRGIHDRFVEYWDNGLVKVSCDYIEGKVSGPKYRYYEDGVLESMEYTKNGVRHGQTIKFNRDGMMHSYIEYENGELGGLIIEFKNGILDKLMSFKGGDCTYMIVSSSTHIVVERYKDTKLNGVSFVYNKTLGMEYVSIN
jgi:antitoxin component YwqK of YwqJK toxin-antitoxin module